MTDQAAAPPAQALAAAVSHLRPGDAPPVTAVEAAHRIIAWHSVARALFTVMHGEIMQAAWVIRRELPERADFDRFARDHGLADVMDPDRVWLAAETWEVARSQRSLLATVNARPEEAMRFVWEFVSASAEDRLRRLEPDDARVAGVLALPPRKRTSEIRRLIEMEEVASAGRSAADVEQIRALTEERDAAMAEIERREVVAPIAGGAAGHVRELHREAADALRALAGVTERFEAHMGHPHPRTPATVAAADAMLELSDELMAVAERISGAVLDREDTKG